MAVCVEESPHQVVELCAAWYARCCQKHEVLHRIFVELEALEDVHEDVQRPLACAALDARPMRSQSGEAKVPQLPLEMLPPVDVLLLDDAEAAKGNSYFLSP